MFYQKEIKKNEKYRYHFKLNNIAHSKKSIVILYSKIYAYEVYILNFFRISSKH